MSAYPPPPPAQYPPVYDRRAAKEQRRALQQQARLQRTQAKLQYRALRHGSLVGPLILVALGVVFLQAQTGKLSWTHTLEWYGHWWPVVLIGAGLLLLAEWAIDQHTAADGTPRVSRTIGGGVVVLLIFLAIGGIAAHGLARGLQWKDQNFGMGWKGWDTALGDTHDWDASLSAPMPAGGMLTVRDPHGDVTVTGSSEDGQVHVSVHKRARVFNDHDAADKERLLQPAFSQDGTNLVLQAADVRSATDDLTIELPRGTSLTINADDGAVNVQEIHGSVSVSANHGEVNLSGIDGAVTAHINDNDAGFSAHSITGGVALDGHAGDVTISDVTGAVDLKGAFFGSTHVEHVNGAVSFKTYRTQFTAARVDGEFEVSTDSELQGSEILGPLVLKTTDRDITLDRVQGSVNITNTDGPVKLTNASPMSTIDINNHDGSVDVGLPEGAGFTVSAQTKDGDIENDFGLAEVKSGDQHTLTGKNGSGGPAVTLVTTDGDITVRRSLVAPLPPAPPPTPKITTGPEAPTAPKPPSALRPRHTPKAPAAP